MKRTITLIALIVFSVAHLFSQNFTGKELLEKVDANMSSKNRIITSKMIVHGQRSSRTIEAKSWTEGDNKSFTEYLSPEREAGTKMLKLEDKLWMYSPSTDRTIQISGHMLRQSVMGSDLSYEDMMEDSKLTDKYDAKITGSETIDDRPCWVVELTANTPDIAYYSRKLWIDKDRFIPLKEELFAKSGTLLKRMEMKDVTRIEGRWYPKTILFKDVLKSGDGTEFISENIQFNQEIPDYIFSKASLKR